MVVANGLHLDPDGELHCLLQKLTARKGCGVFEVRFNGMVSVDKYWCCLEGEDLIRMSLVFR